jgi:hypothetical protein
MLATNVLLLCSFLAQTYIQHTPNQQTHYHLLYPITRPCMHIRKRTRSTLRLHYAQFSLVRIHSGSGARAPLFPLFSFCAPAAAASQPRVSHQQRAETETGIVMACPTRRYSYTHKYHTYAVTGCCLCVINVMRMFFHTKLTQHQTPSLKLKASQATNQTEP